jgi:hypothetical protein
LRGARSVFMILRFILSVFDERIIQAELHGMQNLFGTMPLMMRAARADVRTRKRSRNQSSDGIPPGIG